MTKVRAILLALVAMVAATAYLGGSAVAATGDPGYWLVDSRSATWPFGSASSYVGPAGNPRLRGPVVGAAGLPGRTGLWEVASDGGVFDFGSANDSRFYGSAATLRLSAPIVGMAVTRDGGGYWLVGADGGVFTFGNARFFGSAAGRRLNAPIVGMARSPSGNGYELAAADGGVFTFGDAVCWGCETLPALQSPIVGIVGTPGPGYWLVAADGGVFARGPHSPNPPVGARFFGSLGGTRLNKPIVGMAATADFGGYWLVAADGGVFAFGDATFAGSASPGSTSFRFVAMVTVA